MKVVNYTPEQVTQAVEAYQNGETIETIAMALGKSTRSVIAKLSKEKVYVPKAKPVGTRVTKATLVAAVAAYLNLEAKELESLEKGTHEALEALMNAARKLVSAGAV